jgi:hypothetical protein
MLCSGAHARGWQGSCRAGSLHHPGVRYLSDASRFGRWLRHGRSLTLLTSIVPSTTRSVPDHFEPPAPLPPPPAAPRQRNLPRAERASARQNWLALRQKIVKAEYGSRDEAYQVAWSA